MLFRRMLMVHVECGNAARSSLKGYLFVVFLTAVVGPGVFLLCRNLGF
jgi:hypothetical protein